MEDTLFLQKINRVAGTLDAALPAIDRSAGGEALAAWARFLRGTVDAGVRLSDPRWSRVRITEASGHSRFALEHDGDATADDDFRLGLQLLFGLFEGRDDMSDPDD